jgi:hypothetical protein
VTNGLLLCDACHRLVHGGWQVAVDDAFVATFTSPGARTYVTRPAGMAGRRRS